MNQQNAEATGRTDGKDYQQMQKGLHKLLGGTHFLSKEEYKRQGKIKAYADIRSAKNRALYIKGWNEAWEGD